MRWVGHVDFRKEIAYKILVGKTSSKNQIIDWRIILE